MPAVSADGAVDVRLAYGYDSNPLELADDGGGAFTEAGLTASLRLRPERHTQFFFRASGAERMHESSASDADSTRGSARAAAAFIPYKKGHRRLALLVGGDYVVRRSTFVDPETGSVFRYLVSDPLGTTQQPIPDRFDSDSIESFVDLRFRVNRRVRLRLVTRHEQRDYVEDYPEIAGLDSIDHDALSIRPGIEVALAPGVSVALSYSSIRREYDEQPARDSAGFEIAGTTREYDYDGVHLAMSWAPTGALDLRFGALGTDRSDLHAGYYDSERRSVYGWLEGSLGERHRYEAYVSRLYLDYDNATVANDPNGEVRGLDAWSGYGRYERDLARGFGLFVELGAQRVDNEDPALAYDKDWLMTGFQYRR
jgi:hypothetical protein